MVEFLKIQFQIGKVTREQIEKLVSNGKLTSSNRYTSWNNGYLIEGGATSCIIKMSRSENPGS